MSGGPLEAVAGDALALEVVDVAADGSIAHLPAGARVQWTVPQTVWALPPGGASVGALPGFGAQPTAVWIDNPSRPDRNADLNGVLFVLDPGSVQNGAIPISATVSGASAQEGNVPSASAVAATVSVDPTPAGDWTRGAISYGGAGANCARCHGPTGHGSAPNAGGTTYTLAGATYDYPAPGLNAEPGNPASDPTWNAALFAVASRADMDNQGVTLRVPMPDWLARTNPASGKPLTTQDFADIFAFLKTQTH